jgi:integrase
MASVYKRKRDRQRKNASWFIAYSDENGVRRAVKGCPDKAATEAMARKLESEAELRRRGVIDPKSDQYANHEARPLTEHLDAWRTYLLGKGNSHRHADEGHARVVKLMTLAKANRLSDLSLTRLQAALATLKSGELSLRTIHHYTRLAKNFARWAWRDGRAREDLLAHLQPPDNPESDRRRERRAFSVDELERLVHAAEQGPVRRRLSGRDRAMLYRITAGTGFRSEEMQSLTPESFDLDGPCPTITVEAVDSKRRKRDVQPIQPALALFLKPWLIGKPNCQPLFAVSRWAILAALQGDELAAGIQYENEQGFADFHALRHSFITTLAKSNAPVKIVQSLARHSTPVLTLGVYTHLGLYDQTPALDALPDLTRPAARPEAAKKTGTDDAPVSRLDADLTAHGQRAGDVFSQIQSLPDVIAGSTVQNSMNAEHLKKGDHGAHSRGLTLTDAQGSASVAGARPGLQNR